MRDLRREGMLPSAPASRKYRLGVTLALSAWAALLVAGSPAGVQAQIDPDDTGEGRKLGLSAEHNSGQTGTVTVRFGAPGQTVVVASIFSVPRGLREIARIRRAPSCRSRGRRGIRISLSIVANGLSRTTIALAMPRLLSGNYIVEILTRANVRVSCGELHG